MDGNIVWCLVLRECAINLAQGSATCIADWFSTVSTATHSAKHPLIGPDVAVVIALQLIL